MSYAICNVVCGYELPDALRDYLNSIDADYEGAGFKEDYSGSGDTPAWSGVSIGSFDECNNMTAEQMIKLLQAKPEQIAEAERKMAATREAVEEVLCDLGEKERNELLACLPVKPEVVLIWGSS